MPPYDPQQQCPPINCPPGQRREGEVQCHSRWAANDVDAVTPNLIPVKPILSAYSDVSKWWNVSLWGFEVARNEVGVNTPLSKTDIENAGTALTRLKVRVFSQDIGNGFFRDVDIAHGARFAIRARSLRVMLLGPENECFVEQPESVLPAGLILDTFIDGAVSEGEAAVSRGRVTNTIVTGVAATVAGATIPITPGSINIQIFQTSAGNVPADASFVGSIPVGGAGPNLGQIDFNAGGRRTDVLGLPAWSAFWATGAADPITPRVFTTIYEIDL